MNATKHAEAFFAGVLKENDFDRGMMFLDIRDITKRCGTAFAHGEYGDAMEACAAIAVWAAVMHKRAQTGANLRDQV